MNDRLRLPFAFDAAAMRADVERLQAGAWIRHFVTQNYDGEWTVLPLRAPASATHPVQMIHSDPGCDTYADTPLLAECPAIAAALATFRCPLESVRLMRLGAGSAIKTHCDNDLDVEHGRARLHIPIETNPAVDFRLNGDRVVLGEGECWYLRLSDPHSVANRGDRDRVHLVIDAIVSPWLHECLDRAQAEAGAQPQRLEPPAQPDAAAATPSLPSWVPIHLHTDVPGRPVEWCEVGAATFADPFFSDTIARLRPEARAARTPFAVLGAEAAAHPGLAPAAFIFHCSRCGSTLLSQLARAVPGTAVVSEAPIVDEVLRSGWTRDERTAGLRVVVAALAQPRRMGDRRAVIKFDAWHVLDLPIVQDAFPGVPCVFVYREPLAVVASQMRMPGQYLLPGELDPAIAGLASAEQAVEVGREEYAARVLGRILREAALHAAAGRISLLNYRDFPDAAIAHVVAWTHTSPDDGLRSILQETAAFDAKAPSLPFIADAGRPAPSTRAESAVERFAREPYDALERLRSLRR